MERTQCEVPGSTDSRIGEKFELVLALSLSLHRDFCRDNRFEVVGLLQLVVIHVIVIDHNFIFHGCDRETIFLQLRNLGWGKSITEHSMQN